MRPENRRGTARVIALALNAVPTTMRRMDWFYENQGQQAGPVTRSELDALIASGTIGAHALVWRSGQAEWQPYSTLAPVSADAGAPTIPDGAAAVCAECGGTFASSEMIRFEGAHVCARCKPIFVQKLKEGVRTGGTQIWRSGKQLVAGLNATLPERCVKCNVATTGERLKRVIYWHHPAVYIVLVINLLIYAIVAASVRKRATLLVAICPEHRRQRKMAILTSWLLILAGIGAIVAGVAYNQPYAMVGGIAILLGGAIYGTMRGRVISARKIDKEHAWVGGVCGPYLDELPEWTG